MYDDPGEVELIAGPVARSRSRGYLTHGDFLERLRFELASKNESELAQLRASIDLTKTKLLGAHTDMVAMYRIVANIVAEMIADIAAAPQGVGGFAEIKDVKVPRMRDGAASEFERH